MKRSFVLSFLLALSFSLFSQWGPMPALKGGGGLMVSCDGQNIVTGNSAGGVYY